MMDLSLACHLGYPTSAAVAPLPRLGGALTHSFPASGMVRPSLMHKQIAAACAAGFDTDVVMSDTGYRFPSLMTQRLTLVSPAEAGFDAHDAFLRIGAPRFIDAADDPDALWWSIATIIGHWHLRGYGLFALVERSTGRPVGMIGPWFPKGWPEPELSWHLTEDARGKGYASEAAEAVLDWLFREKNWSNIASFIPEDNAASIALAQRIGARPEQLVSFRLAPANNMRTWRHQPRQRLLGEPVITGRLQ
ncbi:acetyltransferase, GNAT family [Phaeobacter gallaeciensis]|uniref:Acetyltransferase, GNAT family n=2 Tax=Phaeobacter gallaeciensis TaxID=60890 RepID=A0AAD0EBC2_9RHOB|nr:Acetyltransferase [Phaeobacter gallaeciensis DSM 26640]ATE91261.1 acetyltransferase, GNAT family [Phaeobacter gallaeciensis]ATE95537.1 acetyltransferase, GNAT family [Phaeobacter gallaeciensis]ATE99876.1 acetyltransferase, GNAT family [Phaeobacter gallaeciensis]ATF04309.1 acetyltransferase, GNAT family [Phaeobacter gallaeciensis]